MRKLIAITLLVVFGLPLATSLFALAPKSEANLPACCRRNGKHHCMMSVSERKQLSDKEKGFSAPAERCPFAPFVPLQIHPSINFLPSPGQRIYADLMSHPACLQQVESMWRTACEQAHGKRGPPSSKTL